MTTDVDIIRTVFEAQFTGRNVIRDVVRELGIAKQAADSFSHALGLGKASADFASNVRSSTMAISSLQRIIDKNILQEYGTRVSDVAKAVQGSAMTFEAGATEIEKYGHVLAETTGISEELKAQLLGTEPAVTGLAAAWQGLSKNMQMAVIAGAGLAAGLVAIGAALYKLYPVAKEGAGMAQLTMSFESLNRNILKTPNLIDDMGDAAKGTITDIAAMEGFLTLTAGATESASRKFAQAAPQLMEIAKAANKLNPTLGDTNYMFNSLARGIKRSETRLLDNLGLNIKVASANTEYAKAIGKTVIQLTAEDKQMALLNETLRVGAELINQVGGNTDSLTDRFDRMTVAWGNFVNAWKMNLAASFPEGEGPIGQLEKQARANELGAKLKFALQQGIDVGYKDNGAFIRYSLKQLEYFNNQLEKEYQRRADIEKRYRAGIDATLKANRDAFFAEGGVRDQYQQGYGRQDPRTTAPISSEMLAPPPSYSPWQAEQDRNAYLAKKEIEEKIYTIEAEAVQKRRELQKQFYTDVRDMQGKAAAHNEQVMAEYMASIANTGKLMRSVSGDNGFYTKSIEDIGSAWITVGGRTEEQNADLEDLQRAYENVNDDMRDYRLGIKGYGEDADKVAEKLNEWAGEAEFLKGKIDELNGVVGESARVFSPAVWDFGKIGQSILDGADAAGVGAVNYALFAQAIGEWDKAQAEAALKAGAAAGLRDKFLADLRDNPFLTPAEIASKWDQLQRDIEAKGAINIDMILNPPALEDPKSIADRSTIMNESAGYLSKEGIFTDFADEASRTGEQARKNLIEELFGVQMPKTMEMAVNVDTKGADAVLESWMNQERSVFVRVVAGMPDTSGKGGDSPVGTGRATGGPVFGNSPYIVGERGPELFVPKGNGTIIPNDQLGGNSSINIYNYNERAAALNAALIAQEVRRQTRQRAW